MHKNNYRYTNDSLPPMDGAGDYPIAMAYVPMQKFTHLYSAAEGYKAGTLFKELDLPFKGGKRQ